MSNDRHDEMPEKPAPLPSRDRSLVFISHDTRDAELAEAFSRLLSRVSAGVLKSFRSSDRKGNQGIEYGSEWYPEIMANLDRAFSVVCLLTRRSVDRPWILYEAGVAKGKLDTKVHGLALGIPLNVATTGPFAQFQNSDDDIDSLTKLVMQLLKHIPNAEPDIEAVQMQVQIFKSQVDKILSELGEVETNTDKKEEFNGTSVAKLFEEVKIMFQDLPSRVENITNITNTSLTPGSPDFYLYTLNDFISDNEGGYFNNNLWLILISSFQNNIPWLYEAGMEVYRSQRSYRSPTKTKSLKDFYQLLTLTLDRYYSISILSDSQIELSYLCKRLESYLNYHINSISNKNTPSESSDGK